MCFDVSHSMLTSNFLKQDFYEFAEKILPYTAHIHMGDASGVNGEGLQIGESELIMNSDIGEKFSGSLTAAIVNEDGADKIELEEV